MTTNPAQPIRRNYQKEGIIKQIRTLKQYKGFLNASQAGVGKTNMALGICSPKKLPVLILCPATLKENWIREIALWCGEDTYKSYIVSGAVTDKKKDQVLNSDIVIVNYELLVRESRLKETWSSIISNIDFNILICDEAHRIRNQETKTCQAVQKLGKKTPYVGFLTATPVEANPTDLFPMLNMIDPVRFDSFSSFANRYSMPYFDKRSGQVKYKGCTKPTELNNILQNYMIRYKKCDILKELPPKIHNFVHIPVTNYSEYVDLCSGIKENVGGSLLSQVQSLRQCISRGKLKGSIEWIRDFLEGNPDEKLVVMGYYKETLEKIHREFSSESVLLYGETKAKERFKTIDKFMNDDSCRLFVGNIKSAGVGINLVSSCNLAFVEISYLPSDIEQVSDRIHRIGQTSHCVNIYFLMAKDTADERMMEINDVKKAVASKVVDGVTVDLKHTLEYLLK